jgi:branched-chain amino acid transport system substrate-binding protein
MRGISRHWKLVLPLGAIVLLATVVVSTSFAASKAKTVKLAILTDCKGVFGGAYENTLGAAQAAFANYANGKVVNNKKPSAGMTGMRVGTTPIKIVGYGCGDDTAPTAIKEVRRLVEQLGASVIVGPLSGDEAVAVANYAKTKPNVTFVIGGAGSQDPTLQIAPKNVFRYHGDGAQWNAGIGEIAYKKLGWRTAAIIADDYSFGWTSAAGMIADFCAVGGKITKRVFPPLGTTDYSSFVAQLPAPGAVDGTFWAVGGTGTAPALTAYEQKNGALDPKKHIGNLFFAFLGADKVVGPKVATSYVGGFGTGPGLKTAQAKTYEKVVNRWYPGLNGGNYADGFLYNYFNAAWAAVQGLTVSKGQIGAALQSAMPKTLRSGYSVSSGGKVTLDANRQAIQDQYQLQMIKNADGSVGPQVVGFVPGVEQSFGGLFKKTSPPPGRTQPKCVKNTLPWQGKIKVVKNGVITPVVIK